MTSPSAGAGQQLVVDLGGEKVVATKRETTNPIHDPDIAVVELTTPPSLTTVHGYRVSEWLTVRVVKTSLGSHWAPIQRRDYAVAGTKESAERIAKAADTGA
jgi:hypothetical protein